VYGVSKEPLNTFESPNGLVFLTTSLAVCAR